MGIVFIYSAPNRAQYSPCSRNIRLILSTWFVRWDKNWNRRILLVICISSTKREILGTPPAVNQYPISCGSEKCTICRQLLYHSLIYCSCVLWRVTEPMQSGTAVFLNKEIYEATTTEYFYSVQYAQHLVGKYNS
jgi:hypothetical protein